MTLRKIGARVGFGCLVAIGLLPPCGALARPPAQPAADSSHILTVQLEDDVLGGTDRYYTSGERIGLTMPTGQVPDAIARLGHAVFGPGQQRIEYGLSQLLFTPRNTQLSPPDPYDRPYAALLLGDMSLIQDTARTRTILTAQLGMIGPAALGRQAQNTTHRVLNDRPARGWAYQLPNQPVIQFYAQRIWRVPVVDVGPFQTDLLPALEAGVGTWRDYALGGVQLRFGQGLNSDFGVPRIRPGLNGGDAYHATRPFAWYLFVGGDLQAVAFDETISGEPFSASRHVTLNPTVGEFQFGATVMAGGARLTFADILQTHEFRNQQGGLFQFASVSLSVRF